MFLIDMASFMKLSLCMQHSDIMFLDCKCQGFTIFSIQSISHHKSPSSIFDSMERQLGASRHGGK